MDEILALLVEGLEALKEAYLEADGIPKITEPLASAALKVGMVEQLLRSAVEGMQNGNPDSTGS